MRYRLLASLGFWLSFSLGWVGAQQPVTVTTPRPPAIRTESVPEVPARIADQFGRYRQVEWASFADWSHAGGLLFSSRIGNLSQLYHLAAPGKTPQQLTSADEPVTEARALPDQSVLFSRGAGGDENYQIFRLFPDRSEPRRLTDGKSRNLINSVDISGRRLAYTSTARNGRDADVYWIDLEAKEARAELVLQVENETWSLDDWSGDGSRALLTRYVSANETYPHVVELATRTRRPLPPETAEIGTRKVRRDNLLFSTDTRSIYLATDARGEFRELARLDLASGTYTWLSDDLPFDVEDLELSRDGRLAVFSLNAGGYSRIFSLDLEQLAGGATAKNCRRELSLPRGLATGLTLDPAGKHLGFTWGSASTPAEAHSFDLAANRLERWTMSRNGGFVAGDFVEPELVQFASFDGREIPAFVFRPRQTGKSAVVINIHGGPEGQSRPVFSARTQFWVRELGAAVVFPNVRGSTGYGKTYSQLDDGLRREDSVRDIGALLDWIGKDERLDASRVAVYGGSYGGYMVLASLVHFRDRLKAGVDAVGISNFQTFLENTSAYRRDLRRVEYGDERDPTFREFFARISPAERIHEIRAALFLVHGDNDPRVPISEAKQIVARARTSGRPVWTLYAANEGHSFARRENADYLDAVTAVFFQQHLLSSAPSAETPVAQALRELDARLAQAPATGPLLHERATILFRLGKFAESVADYDRAIELGGRTHSSDACWERGLARYYARDFAGGRLQFEGYHKVGPLDIENGLWIYLCEAARSSVATARAALPAYPDRRRPPFPALLDLYLDSGTIEAVFAQARAVDASPAERNEAVFYAHLYVGKYLQTVDRATEARSHFKQALDLPLDHFMYWCAQAEVTR